MTHKILLADDSVTIQKVIELTFMDQDYEVTAVSTGDEAVDSLVSVDPDLVIADVHMPGASGYEVARRSKERKPGVPVLLLVGTFEPFDEGEMAESGADSHLKKPFDSQELLQLVESLMASAGEATEEPADAPEEAPEEASSSEAAEATEGEAPHAIEMGDGSDPTWGNLDLDDSGTEEATGGDVLSLDTEGMDDDLSLDDDFRLEDEAPPGETETTSPPSTQVMPPDGDGDDSGLADEPFQLDSPPVPPMPSTEVAPPPDLAPPAAEPPQAPAGQGPPGDGASDSEAARSEAAAAPEEVPREEAAASPVGGLSDEDVDRIARRVAELVGQDAVRHVAWEVVPDLAEVLIKDRIRQLESQVE